MKSTLTTNIQIYATLSTQLGISLPCPDPWPFQGGCLFLELDSLGYWTGLALNFGYCGHVAWAGDLGICTRWLERDGQGSVRPKMVLEFHI